jgi:hypothetical protein
VSRYRRSVELEPDELDRLGGAILARPVMLETWALGTGRRELADAAQWIEHARAMSKSIANRARSAFAAACATQITRICVISAISCMLFAHAI